MYIYIYAYTIRICIVYPFLCPAQERRRGLLLLNGILLSRRREHLHARALQIRAELSTHIHRETGPQRPTHSFCSFLFEKTKLECCKQHRLFASAVSTTLYAMPRAAGQPAALQGTEPGQGHLRGTCMYMSKFLYIYLYLCAFFFSIYKNQPVRVSYPRLIV